MSTVQTQTMTAEEFWEWTQRPENQERLFELEEGEPVEMPSSGELHGAICALIAHLMWAYVFRCGAGYVCGNDTGLLVKQGPDTVRGPDVMLFGEARRLEDLRRKFATGIPLLVVEVLSPHDQMSKVNLRLSQYLERGVRLVWLVDPEARVVTVYQADRFHRVLDETEELTGNGVLADFRCRVTDLFTLPGETSAQPPAPKQP